MKWISTLIFKAITSKERTTSSLSFIGIAHMIISTKVLFTVRCVNFLSRRHLNIVGYIIVISFVRTTKRTFGGSNQIITQYSRIRRVRNSTIYQISYILEWNKWRCSTVKIHMVRKSFQYKWRVCGEHYSFYFVANVCEVSFQCSVVSSMPIHAQICSRVFFHKKGFSAPYLLSMFLLHRL